jgi:hypothetical protein
MKQPDTIERFLRVERLTFRKIHVLVVALTIGSLIFLILAKLHVVVPRQRHLLGWEAVSENPTFLILYNVVLAVGFWIIYATRHNASYYRLRAYVYGMLLGGIAGEVLHFLAKRVLHV